MPRNPASKRNQHNTRHENGLVGPGKRVTKQKSNGQLNGSVKPVVSEEPLSGSMVSDPPVNLQSTTSSRDSLSDPKSTASTLAVHPGLKKRGSESSQDERDAKWENVNGNSSHTTKRFDMVTSKSKSAQDVSAFQIASTILRSCPASDTVALLIVLLALPSMVLTIVQALFASLTLMPPTGVSPVAFLSLFDVFQGSSGSPSIGTMAFVDAVFFVLWICLWNWAQNFALDLAQIQIAITLGKGNSDKNGSVNVFCFTIVLMMHTFRSQGVRRFLLAKLVPSRLLSNPRVTDIMQYLPSESDFGESPNTPSKIRSLFALHIISQALMAFVRRKLQGSSSSSKSGKRADTEATAGASTSLDTSVQDSTFNTAAASGVDHQPPPTPGFKDGREKGLSAKKRRRQANQVKSRQPFWAALASTKVHVLREVEHSKGHPGSSNVQESLAQNDQPESVWITNVEPSAIQFQALCCMPQGSNADERPPSDPKPFSVRINGARWHSLVLECSDDSAQEEGTRLLWNGSISGLAPDCTYTCSFTRLDRDEEFASLMVKTPAIQEGDQMSSSIPLPARQSTRPSSPTTTLKTSIQAAEVKRDDGVNRRNKVRRNHKSTLAKMDKDIESWQNKLRSGSDDTKLRQKLLQAERSGRQHEEATVAINAALDDLQNIPEDESEEYESKKAAFDDLSSRLTESNESLAEAKSGASNDCTCANTELSTTIARKERLTTKRDRLISEHDRLTQANLQNMSEKERKAVESAAREQDQQRQEIEMSRRVDELQSQLHEFRGQNQGLWREVEALDATHRETMMKNNGPLSPEGTLPGSNSLQQQMLQQRSFPFGGLSASNFIPDPHASPFMSYTKFANGRRRSRSETNRSIGAMSGFSAEFEDADPIPPMPKATDFDVNGQSNGRKGSGSSRGQSNGSPATGVIGGGVRSPHRDVYSPGQLQGTSSW